MNINALSSLAPHHARVLEGVAKSQFPYKAVVFRSGDRVLTQFLRYDLRVNVFLKRPPAWQDAATWEEYVPKIRDAQVR